MKNITLNAGGGIGAALGAALGGGLAFLFYPEQTGSATEAGRVIAPFTIGGLIAGAMAGNQLWELLTKKSG